MHKKQPKAIPLIIIARLGLTIVLLAIALYRRERILFGGG